MTSTANTTQSDSELPAVDVRLVAPESRYEVDEGRLEYVAPADEPHGSRHSKLSALLEAYAAADRDVASDMLTRTSEMSDVAPDASVFPSARDPETGGRQLEELAFEVASTERLNHAAKKARKLADRGVRRVFAIDVARKRALEWSRRTDSWQPLPRDAHIEDGAFVTPLAVSALVDAAKADDAMAHALVAKRNPVIERVRAEGKLEGKIEALLALLKARHIALTSAERERIVQSRDMQELEAWFDKAIHCPSAAELFDGS